MTSTSYANREEEETIFFFKLKYANFREFLKKTIKSKDGKVKKKTFISDMKNVI